MIATLSPLGFDWLTDVKPGDGSTWLVVDYKNTDEVLQPEQLCDLLAIDNEAIHSHQTLISIFYRDCSSDLLTKQLNELIAVLPVAAKPVIIDSNTPGQLKVVADQSTADELYQNCHRRWIEQSSSSAFGHSWQYFVE
jgi:hypothetical protein